MHFLLDMKVTAVIIVLNREQSQFLSLLKPHTAPLWSGNSMNKAESSMLEAVILEGESER